MGGSFSTGLLLVIPPRVLSRPPVTKLDPGGGHKLILKRLRDGEDSSAGVAPVFNPGRAECQSKTASAES